MSEYITCAHCGVVKRGHICPHKKRHYKDGDKQSDKFRSTKVWQRKREEIKQKSKYLCAVCFEGKHHTMNILNHRNLEVHHIVPLAENYNKRLDNDNLICLCSFHHKMAEKCLITRTELNEMVKWRDKNEED